MNIVQDLFLNPVTIIGAILAVMFISMGYLRHLGTKRSRKEKELDVRPVNVTDPFMAHPPAPKPRPSIPPTIEPARPERTLRQFGNVNPTPDEKSGYLWE